MARSGPLTRDVSTIALGLAQIRTGNSKTHIAVVGPILTSSDSIGALASTKFSGSVDYWKLESGFPLLEDLSIPLRESATLEAAYKEISFYNMALSRGLNVEAVVGDDDYEAGVDYTKPHEGTIKLGTMKSPAFIRMEAVYTYPDGESTMTIIFPRANITSSAELDLQAEDAAAPSILFEAKRSDGDTAGGNAVHDTAPLGTIVFAKVV